MASQSPQGIDVSVPTGLDSAQAKLVYLYVAASGTATAERLCDDLCVQKGTILSITSTLRDRGLLERTDSGFQLA